MSGYSITKETSFSNPTPVAILGWDSINETYRIVGVDSNDNLLIAGAVTISNSISLLPPTSIGSGSTVVATAGTRVRLVSSNTPCLTVTIKAKNGNTGTIYVGDLGVSSANGYPLRANETLSFNFTMANANTLWIDSSINGEGVDYFYTAT